MVSSGDKIITWMQDKIKAQTKNSEVVGERCLTLNVEHHAVCDLLISVRDDARELLFVGLAARYHHIVAPDRHCPILVASLLVSGFAFQPGIPFDHAWGLSIRRYTSCNCHLTLLSPSHNRRGRQGHTCHGPSCRVERRN